MAGGFTSRFVHMDRGCVGCFTPIFSLSRLPELLTSIITRIIQLTLKRHIRNMENSAVMNGRDNTQEVKTPLEHAFGQVNLQSQVSDRLLKAMISHYHLTGPYFANSTRFHPWCVKCGHLLAYWLL